MWTSKEKSPFNYWKPEQEEFYKRKCRFTNCFLTKVRIRLDFDLTKFDAIIFNGRSLQYADTTDYPGPRSYHQKYIFLNTESSDSQPICSLLYDEFFNWTATYKLNSDIKMPHMVIQDMRGVEVGPRIEMPWMEHMSAINETLLQSFKKRTKAAAWLVSKCHTRSKRETYAKKLKKELKKLNLTLDVYGQCGNVRVRNTWEDLFRKKYFFYLAFEDSIAEDFVTEELTIALRNDVVPIVYGGANYSRFLPPGSYIDARKHEPKALAFFMLQLIRTPEAYHHFFRWKNHYTYHRPEHVCDLCAALNNRAMVDTRTEYKEFRRWWNPDYEHRCKDKSWGLTVKKLFLITSVLCLFVWLGIHRIKPRTSNIKYILMWVPSLPAIEPFIAWKPGQEEFEERKCRYTNCYLTDNRYKLGFNMSKFDAILFNGQSLKLINESSLPPTRWYHQKYIFLNTESSDSQPICNPLFDGYFNWTATYKLDSDISYSFMIIRNSRGDRVGPRVDMTWVKNMSEFNDLKSLQMFNERTRAAAWFVSHCHTRSKREEYVEKLKYELKYLDFTLDVYGKCSSMKCPRRTSWCIDLFKNTYFFYIAFENSFAEDYITEKVLTALLNDVVPILYGAANYSRFLPPGSYIDARKYEPKELASLMAHLIRTPAAYNDFFRWKNHYSYHRPANVCGLCAALNNQTMMETRSIADFRRWWNHDFQERCKDGLNWGT